MQVSAIFQIDSHYLFSGGQYYRVFTASSERVKTAKLNNLKFHPLEVVSRYRKPQIQVGEN